MILDCISCHLTLSYHIVHIDYLQKADDLAGQVTGSPGDSDVPDDVSEYTDQSHQQIYTSKQRCTGINASLVSNIQTNMSPIKSNNFFFILFYKIQLMTS